MENINKLYEQYGIITRLDSVGRVTGVGKCLEMIAGNDVWQTVRQMMIEAEGEARSLKKDERIIAELQRHIVVLYPSELRRLLEGDPDLYMKAIKRGKSELRYRANDRRSI